MPLPPERPSGRARLFAIAVTGLAIALPASAREWGRPLFEWTDAQGSVRYTSYPERVPAARRDSLREMKQRVGEPNTGSIALGEFESDTAGGSAGGVVGGTAGAAGSSGATTPTAADPMRRSNLSELDREIAALEAKIARDQEILKTLISDPEAAPELSNSGDLAAIAGRLPEEQAALHDLLERRERERSAGTTQ